MAEVQIKKKRTFKKYTFRGVDLDQLLNLKTENLVELLGCRQRRHYARGIKRREENLLKRLRAVSFHIFFNFWLENEAKLDVFLS